MNDTNNMPEINENEKREKLEFAVRIIRITGCLFVLASGVFYFNVLGIQDFIGINEGAAVNITSATLLMMGLLDIFYVPRILLNDNKIR